MMNIILGASGRVGAAVVASLTGKDQPVKAVIRNNSKADGLKKHGADIAIADYFDSHALKEAFKNGDALFAITPEAGTSGDVLGDTKKLIDNYREALTSSSIKKIVGLSSMGAQLDKGTGNLLMSYMLEHGFEGLDVETTFIRPAYYYSNWIMNLDTVKETGILPTFYPVDLAIPMISPEDVGKYAADIIQMPDTGGKIYELKGPIVYSSKDVASAFGVALGITVTAQQIPREKWEETLQGLGFTPDAVKNFVDMTGTVIEGKAKSEEKSVINLTGKTTLQQYVLDTVNRLSAAK